MLEAVTPRQAEAAQRRKAFHSAIAERAKWVPQKQDSSYSIPNTPFGVPKIPADRIVDKIIFVAPAYSYTWCYDLVRFGELYASTPFVPRKIRISDIQQAVAAHFDVRIADIISARRTAIIVRPRQVAVFLAKSLTGCSLPEIGRRFGGRDHTTILWSVRKVAALMEANTDFRAEIESLAASLGGRIA